MLIYELPEIRGFMEEYRLARKQIMWGFEPIQFYKRGRRYLFQTYWFESFVIFNYVECRHHCKCCIKRLTCFLDVDKIKFGVVKSC